MNATRLLKSRYDHHGLELDLHGHIDDDGYTVTAVKIPGTKNCIPADIDFRSFLSAWCDDNLPTSEELLRDARDEALADRAESDRGVTSSERAESLGRMKTLAGIKWVT